MNGTDTVKPPSVSSREPSRELLPTENNVNVSGEKSKTLRTFVQTNGRRPKRHSSSELFWLHCRTCQPMRQRQNSTNSHTWEKKRKRRIWERAVCWPLTRCWLLLFLRAADGGLSELVGLLGVFLRLKSSTDSKPSFRHVAEMDSLPPRLDHQLWARQSDGEICSWLRHISSRRD